MYTLFLFFVLFLLSLNHYPVCTPLEDATPRCLHFAGFASFDPEEHSTFLDVVQAFLVAAGVIQREKYKSSHRS